MNVIGSLWLLFFLSGILINGYCSNVTSRPDIVNVGAIFTFASTIGRVAKVAIQEAVKDVNSDPNVLRRTKLNVIMRNSNCSGFAGMIEALRFMETDIVAIIGPQSTVVAHVISHFANELHVPLMSFAATDPALSSLQFPFFVRTTHSDLYQMTAIAEIIGHYGWKEVIAIFVDDDYGRNGVSVLNDKLAERRCKISYRGGIHPGSVTRGDIMDLLIKVAVMQSRVVVLHVNPDIGYKVFSVAQYLGMMGDGFVWIATDWLSAVLDSAVRLPSEIMDMMQGVLVLRQHTPDSKRRKSFFSRWNKINGGSLGLNAYGLYAYDSVWLVAHAIDAFFNQGGVISFSNDYRLFSAEGSRLHLEAMSIFDDGDLLLRNILQSNFVGLTGPFKFNPDRSLFRPAYDIINVVGTGHRQIGYWSNYSGLSTKLPEVLYTMPPNRSTASQQLYTVIWPGGTLSIPRGWVFPNNGKQLRVGVPRRVTFQEFVSLERRTDNFQGFCIDVFMAALNLVPYAVPHIFIPFGNGVKNPNYSEFMDLITTGSFDVAVGDIAIVANRTKIVDFTQPYVSSGLVVVAPIEKLHTVAWAFLQPLSRQMWIVTGCFCLFVGIIMWILEHRINNDFRGSPKKQIVTILWFSLSTLFFSHREKPASCLGRMVLLIWLFVVLIVNYSYTASLTSILTVQQLASPIKGIESLKNGDEPIGYQVGSFAERYLSEELNISKSRLKPLASPEEYASALQLGPNKGGVAAIVDERPYAELFLSSQCSFRIVGREFTKNGWGFAFTRNSPLAIDMSAAILQLSENGELQRIHDKWFKQRSCILENAGIESDQLHLQSFIGLFLICGIACFIALLIYFLQTMRRFARDSPTEPTSTSHQGGGTPHSGRFRKILSLMDEKKEHSSHGRSKRRRMEKSLSENDQDGEFRIAPGMDKRK